MHHRYKEKSIDYKDSNLFIAKAKADIRIWIFEDAGRGGGEVRAAEITDRRIVKIRVLDRAK